MRTFPLIVVLVALCSTSVRAQAKALTNDPLTGLPVIPTTIMKSGTNEPDQIPDSKICKSTMKANMYSLAFYMFVDNHDKSKVTVSATVAWYASHLKGFKKLDGYDGQRSQTFFTNADGTTMVAVTGDRAPKGEDGPAYGVTYYRYQPGLSPTTIAGMANGKIVCK